ncbi:hypothetical protein LRU_02165 [Ligilactobacillus ruminis SPM0211]|uniref:Uncharacterized protein n=1 Tax=Ligilactobacillus ruminis SPM0211 TaxID=1040964 RepID=F7R3A6_9LACO|nr:hypothetical protein LRU_02165 [Ligilactobacillus ruminis SPM0211]
MQRLINQRAGLSVKFTAELFSAVSIIAGSCHAYAKNRIRFAVDCKLSGFLI